MACLPPPCPVPSRPSDERGTQSLPLEIRELPLPSTSLRSPTNASTPPGHGSAEQADSLSRIWPFPFAESTSNSANREAVDMMMTILAAHVGKRSIADLASFAFDPSLLFRLYPRHQQRYEDHLEAFEEVKTLNTQTANSEVLSGSFLPRAALASLFARAAYGKMMGRGGGDCCSAFLGNAAAAQCTRHTHAAEVASFCELAAVKESDFLASSWDERTFQPAFVVCWAHEMRWIVVAIRGSMNWKAVLTDVAADVSEVSGGLAHSGMVRASNWVLSQVQGVLCAAAAMHPDYTVMCTGHSMGGNVAALMAVQLRDLHARAVGSQADTSDFASPAFGRTVCYAFGPSPLMSPDLAIRCEPFVLSIARNFDFVTRLSVFGIDKLLLEMTEQSAALLFKQWLSDKFSSESPTSGRAGARHRAFGSSDLIPEPLVPPGRLLHINSRPSSASGTPGQAVQLYWSLPGFYHQLLLSVRMFQDHLPIKYVEDLLSFMGTSAGLHAKELHLKSRASGGADAHIRVRGTLESIIIAQEQGLSGVSVPAEARSPVASSTPSACSDGSLTGSSIVDPGTP